MSPGERVTPKLRLAKPKANAGAATGHAPEGRRTAHPRGPRVCSAGPCAGLRQEIPRIPSADPSRVKAEAHQVS